VKLNNLYEHEIVFEPNRIYYMNKSEVRSYPINEKGTTALQYFDNTANPYYNLFSFNQLYRDPDEKIIDTTRRTASYVTPKKTRQRPYIYYRDYRAPNKAYSQTLMIYQKHNYVPYQRAWLINKRTETSSVIQSYQGAISYPDSGLYDLILLNDTAMCISKDLYLPLDGTLHLFLYANEIKELDQEQTWDYEQTVKRLTKIPLRLFTDSPISIRPVVMKVIKSKNTYGKLSGKVEDAIYHTPMDYVTIIAEVDGRFKGGALTNEDGDFEINFLQPGNYMLKIRIVGYRYQVIYDMKVEAGIEQQLRIRL